MNARSVLLTVILAVASSLANALEMKSYSDEDFNALQKAKRPVAVQFHAVWCSTCWAQKKSLESLKTDKDLDMTLLVANYDLERSLKKRLNVTSQSTIVVFKSGSEAARSSGETEAADLKVLLKKAI